MNYNETLNYIHSLGKFSFSAGLERITAVMNKLGNPQNEFPSIHIAGTNGKGSVSAMLSNVFKTAGYKTGLFISPFIIDFRERIQIDGEFISEADLIKYAEKIIKTEINLTEFEFITALAFLYFKEQKCDIVIAETGLGGRFDATNSLKNTVATVITKIGLDHSAILGDTIEKIAYEKCGIIKGSPVTVISPYQKQEALEVISKEANKLIVPNENGLKILNCDETGTHIIYKGKNYELSLLGEYQIENALTVIEAVENSGYNISYETVSRALSSTYFPARAEIISKNPLVILDGAHNPDGADALARILKKYCGKATAIIGAMKDKDYERVLSSTLPYCKSAVTVTVENMPRSLSADKLKKVAQNYCESFIAENYKDAIDKAIELSENDPIFVFGSLYLAGGIRSLLLEKFKKIK